MRVRRDSGVAASQSPSIHQVAPAAANGPTISAARRRSGGVLPWATISNGRSRLAVWPLASDVLGDGRDSVRVSDLGEHAVVAQRPAHGSLARPRPDDPDRDPRLLDGRRPERHRPEPVMAARREHMACRSTALRGSRATRRAARPESSSRSARRRSRTPRHRAPRARPAGPGARSTVGPASSSRGRASTAVAARAASRSHRASPAPSASPSRP